MNLSSNFLLYIVNVQYLFVCLWQSTVLLLTFCLYLFDHMTIPFCLTVSVVSRQVLLLIHPVYTVQYISIRYIFCIIYLRIM
jgi:hypothetical protein